MSHAPSNEPCSVFVGHTGSFPPIHHSRGRERGLHPRLFISMGSTLNAAEKEALSQSSILVHSHVNTKFFVMLSRCARNFAASSCNPECCPKAPERFLLSLETFLQGTPAVSQINESGYSLTILSNQLSSRHRTSPSGIASGQWAETTSRGSFAISLK